MNKSAFIFPGQGSQRVGMLSEVAKKFPAFIKVFTEASDVLGYDLWKLVQDGPREKLNSTEFAQPAMLAAGFALWRVWNEVGGAKPAFMAGHSFGEYVALASSGAIKFSDAIKLVSKRAELMQQTVPLGKGGMAVIVGLDVESVKNICDEVVLDDFLAPANYNAPGQVVISGDMKALERAIALAKTRDARFAKMLAVSVPAHSELLQPMVEEFKKALDLTTIVAPLIPVIHNATLQSYQDPDKIREALIKQLYLPVRWVETIEFMVKEGVELIFECGPGKVLTGLVKRIEPNLKTVNLDSVEEIKNNL